MVGVVVAVAVLVLLAVGALAIVGVRAIDNTSNNTSDNTAVPTFGNTAANPNGATPGSTPRSTPRVAQLTSNTSCSSISGHSAALGVKVKNTTIGDVLLTGATIHGLPSNLHSTGRVSWSECDPTGSTHLTPAHLAPDATRWVSVTLTLTGTCPHKASPTITVSYSAGSKKHATTFPLGPLSVIMRCP